MYSTTVDNKSQEVFEKFFKKINEAVKYSFILLTMFLRCATIRSKEKQRRIIMKITEKGLVRQGQDGAIFENLLFRFEGNGQCFVYELEDLKPVAEFTLDKAETLVPHCNSVMFGKEYFKEDDEFPLLYANIYNNYAEKENEHCGECCVYRLYREEGIFKTTMVQVIKIGFTDDTLWRSEGVKDVRPWGNFVVDRENSRYYAFVMRDGDKTTRYFALRLPTLADGFEAVLTKEDIIEYFDTPYHNFLQGATCHKGRIYEVEGFHERIRPAIRIIDLEKKEQIFHADFYEAGFIHEPELIDFWGDKCIYGDNKGNIFELEFNN